MKKVVFFLMLVLVLMTLGCKTVEQDRQENYNKCTSVCAATIDPADYVILHLCNEECKKQFLD